MAQKYRKKPVVIEAVRLRPRESTTALQVESARAAAAWVRGSGQAATSYDSSEGPYVLIRTLEGDMKASPGDYIIRGVQGEFYPCKPDIFDATYEPAE
jgi:hypothetical protein